MKQFRSALAVFLLAALAGCAPAPVAPPVHALPVAELHDSLPQSGYVSTGQPDAELLQSIAAAGYTAVVDLRTAGEPRGFDEAGTAASLGLRYVSLPVGGPADVSYENAAELDRILAGMSGPVLLHCASGNRVGALFALRAKAAGASDEEALAIGRRAGLTRFEGVVRERLAERQ